MRVLYIHQYFVEPTGSGGTRSYEFARRLVQDGHRVDLLTSTAFLGPDRQRGRGVQRFTVDGIDVVALPIRYDNTMGRVRRLLAFTRFSMRSAWVASRFRPDLVFATSTPLTVAIPAVVAKLRHRRPMVFEVRDLWPEVPIQMGYLRSGLARRLARRLAKLAYTQSIEIIALSPGMAEGVRAVIGDARRITVVPNAADCELFDPQSERTVPAWWPTTPGEFTAIYTGTFGPANDVLWIADVADQLNSTGNSSLVHIVLVGEGRDRSAVTRRIQELGVQHIVHVADPVPKTEMPAVLATSSVCLCLFAPFTLLETTSPNKFFDALAAGRPVLVNYGGWQDELLTRHNAGRRLSRDPSVAAGQLLDLARDQQDLTTMGTNARRLAVSEFDRDLLYRRFREVLLRAAQPANRGSEHGCHG